VLTVLREFSSLGVTITFADGKVRFKIPGQVDKQALLEKLLPYRDAFNLWLYHQAYPIGELRLYPTRRTCFEAGGCLWLSTGCRLYPLLLDGRLSGYCRERLRVINGGKAKKEVKANAG